MIGAFRCCVITRIYNIDLVLYKYTEVVIKVQ